jgi:hypothetical protein
MRKCLVSLVVVFVSLWSVFTSATAKAEWPAKVFAPYMYLGSGDNFKLTECDDACGLKHYTLAFVIAQQAQSVDENGKKQARIVEDSSGHKVPAWDGRTAMEKDLYHEQIDAIRKRGGDVIVSFGGEAGKELALVTEDPAVLEKTYQSIIDRYKFTWLDFDIEGKALGDMKANERRNEVLAKLQAKNPGLLISFTVPVDPNGVSRETKAMLTDAKAKGVKVHSANVMTMYFGPQHVKDKKLADVCIASAKKAHEDCQKIDTAIQIGLCPMIGKGGDKGAEIFGLDDAKAVEEWAAQQPWVCSLSYWAINRDSGKPGKNGNGNTRSGIEQEPWAFAKIFDQITTR